MKKMTFARTGAWVLMVAVLALALTGCVVAYGEKGQPGAHGYTTGQWQQKQASAENAHRALIARVKKALASDPILNQVDIDFHMREDTVVLTGKLFDLATYEHALDVVSAVEGVGTVVAKIQLNLVR